MRRSRPSLGPALASVTLHLAVIGFIASDFGLASCGRPSAMPTVSEEPEIVVAETISEEEIDRMYRLKEEKERKIREAAERKRKEAEEREARLRQEKLAEEKRLKQEEAREHTEQQRIERAKREAQLAEQQLREREREQLEKERQAKEKAERLAREEAERLAREEAERQAKEKAERLVREEAERQAEEERQRIHARKVAIWTRQYIVDIRRSIERNWTKPPASVHGGDCVVKIKQDKDGKLLDVTIVECDGDKLYQLSVKSAVYKTNPLPEPPSADVFDDEIEITFKQQY